LRHVDQLYCDVKHMDRDENRQLIGQSDALILDALEKILSIKEPDDVVMRIPLIPGSNDSPEDISASSSR